MWSFLLLIVSCAHLLRQFSLLPPNRGSGNTGSSAYSGTDYNGGGSPHRLSSNSTQPSTDTPQTPEDHHRPQLQPSETYHYPGSKFNQKPGSRQTNKTLSPPSSRSTMNVPQLDTPLDTSSLFGDDMFNFSTAKTDTADRSSGHALGTGPKIASNTIISTV